MHGKFLRVNLANGAQFFTSQYSSIHTYVSRNIRRKNEDLPPKLADLPNIFHTVCFIDNDLPLSPKFSHTQYIECTCI